MMEATAAEIRRDEEERRIDDKNEEMQVQWSMGDGERKKKKSLVRIEALTCGTGSGKILDLLSGAEWRHWGNAAIPTHELLPS